MNVKRFKKGFVVLLAVFLSTFQTFAQDDVRGELNTILEEYALPIIISILVLSVATGLITNMDKIIDKHGDGTRKEGIINVIWYLFYAVLFVIVVAAVIALLNSKFSLQI